MPMRAILRLTLFTALIVTVPSLGDRPSAVLEGAAAALDSCDVSGAYTDRLCPGEHLVPNSYLASLNTNYRMYYDGSGNLQLYDYTNPSSPSFLMTVHSADYGEDSPSVFIYSDSACSEFTFSRVFNYTFWDDDDHCVSGASTTGTPEGTHFLRLDNDGCLRVYDQDGLRERWGMPSPEGCFE
jgi:hypothetical protein